MSDFEKAQNWEREWWGDCLNTYGEEEKQIVYAQRMGLEFFHDGKAPYNIDLGGRSVVDIGGGPCSLLLKCINGGQSAVIDPQAIPIWANGRYLASERIIYYRRPFEEITFSDIFWDEAWMYNVLQHVQDPQLVIQNARRVSDLIRVFEWIDTPMNVGHIHTLNEDTLNEWLDGEGKVEEINTPTCRGRAYYGIFPTGRRDNA